MIPGCLADGTANYLHPRLTERVKPQLLHLNVAGGGGHIVRSIAGRQKWNTLNFSLF